MAQPNMTRGTTKNDIPFLRLEGGPKTAMMWSGGPGNAIVSGWLLNSFLKPFYPILEEYTLIMLTRRSDLTDGYTTKMMADDYAELIKAEYGGHVDLIIGGSYGGIVAQHFAADYPDLYDYLVISAAAWKVSDIGKEGDYRFAELLNQNKPRQAWGSMAGALASGPVAIALMRPLLWLMGPSMIGDQYTDRFRQDVLLEAKAEVAHDGRESLKRIIKPTLIQAGEHDKYFPLDLFHETAELIPNGNGKLVVYEGIGHNIFTDEKIARDILNWVGETEKNLRA
ncbi:MAG: alpha/beta hydrolase [Chloroflexota bacterium]